MIEFSFLLSTIYYTAYRYRICMAALLSNIYEAVFNSFDAYTFALALINIAFDLLLVIATIDSVYIMC